MLLMMEKKLKPIYYPDGGKGDAFSPMAGGSTFKDNDGHDWDYGVTKQITEGEFNNILNIASTFESVNYNLIYNNCTSFVQATANAVNGSRR